MMVAKLLYELGDKKNGLKYAKAAIEMSTDKRKRLAVCHLPREFTALALSLLNDTETSTSVAQMLICNKEEKKYLSEITTSLRNIVSDNEGDLLDRIKAAFILLKLGIDPIEEN
jgi:hypothetical protein